MAKSEEKDNPKSILERLAVLKDKVAKLEEEIRKKD